MLDGINRHMRAIIRLSETRAALKVYVSKNELVTYEELAEVLDVSVGKGFMDTLAAVSRDDYNNGRPICTSIVISTNSRFPGKGFFDHAQRLGAYAPAETPEEPEDVQVGNDSMTQEYYDQQVFWLTQLDKLGYDLNNLVTDYDVPATITPELIAKVYAEINAVNDYGEDDEDEPGETDWDEDDDEDDDSTDD
jgi:hypothetical protein